MADEEFYLNINRTSHRILKLEFEQITGWIHLDELAMVRADANSFGIELLFRGGARMTLPCITLEKYNADLSRILTAWKAK